MRRQPKRWKHLVRVARSTALLQAHWEAEKQHFYGLLCRQLQAAGASCSEAPVPSQGHEACGMCGKLFADLRAWSHHAFKVHSRVREERLLVNGKQCPVCLKHYASTEKLCNHVRYSLPCKAALLSSGNRCEPQPGVGSRRFDDGTSTQLPAVQAEGPRARWTQGAETPEKHRPDDSVLCALEDLFSHADSSCCAFEQLVQSYRQAFQSVCLQTSRLVATAREWHRSLNEQLEADEDVDVRWAAWHSTIADRLLEVDWPAWIAPGADLPMPATSTFRDAITVLSWLSFELVCVPDVPVIEHVALCLGVCRNDASVHIAHSDAIASWF